MNTLLERCNAERSNGADFPTVWNKILKAHHLVNGVPVQAIENGESVLKVRLITGHHLVCGPDGYSLE